MQIDTTGNAMISSRLNNIWTLLKIWYKDDNKEFSVPFPYITFTHKTNLSANWINDLLITQSILKQNIQYGTGTYDDNEKIHITFQNSFINTPIVVTSLIGSSTNNLVCLKVDNITKTGFDTSGCYMSNTVNSPSPVLSGWKFNWIAIDLNN